jgi:hypothetical protein
MMWDDIKSAKNKKTEISPDFGNTVFSNFISLVEFLKQLKINEHKEIKAVHKKMLKCFDEQNSPAGVCNCIS